MVRQGAGLVALDSPSVLPSSKLETPEEVPQAPSAKVEKRRRKELEKEQRRQNKAREHEEKKEKLKKEVDQQIGEKGKEVEVETNATASADEMKSAIGRKERSRSPPPVDDPMNEHDFFTAFLPKGPATDEQLAQSNQWQTADEEMRVEDDFFWRRNSRRSASRKLSERCSMRRKTRR